MYPNGDTYEGQWKRGLRFGRGTFTTSAAPSTVIDASSELCAANKAAYKAAELSASEFQHGTIPFDARTRHGHPAVPYERFNPLSEYKGDWDADKLVNLIETEMLPALDRQVATERVTQKLR